MPQPATPRAARQPSVGRNVLANYAAQILVIAMRLVMVPVYLSYMGQEAYGLIGFFTAMAVWFQILDLGLTPTLMRETARFRGGAVDAAGLRGFLRLLETVFVAVAVVGAVALVAAAPSIASGWLKASHLPLRQVTQSVMLMGLAVPLRWIAGLYRGVVNGFEHQVWLGAYNVAINALGMVGVVAIFATVGTDPVSFFRYQLAIAALDLACVAVMAYRLIGRGGPARMDWRALRGNLGFSLTIAFVATVWGIVAQSDKLILSKLLALASYGVFSIAVLGASAINAVAGPFGQAVLPRLTKLIAERDEAAVLRIYGAATQAVGVFVFPVVATLCFFAQPILYAWTGKMEVAAQAAAIVPPYAVGNAFAALCAFPYFMQYAKGDLKLHFIGNAAMALLYLSAVYPVALRYGGAGTGVLWAVLNGLYCLAWVPVVHARVLGNGHVHWLTRDILPIAAAALVTGWILARWMPVPAGRWSALAAVTAAGFAMLAAAVASSSFVRGQLAGRLLRREAPP